MCVSTRVTAASGQSRTVAEGSRLVFGRGPEVDLIIAAGRGLSRRAGVVTALEAGAWIANISRTHALYVEGDGYQVRLPRMEKDEEPASGWFVRAGTAYVGSRAMLDDRQPLVVTVTRQDEEAAGRPSRPGRDGRLAAVGAGLAGVGVAGAGLADGERRDDRDGRDDKAGRDVDGWGRGGLDEADGQGAGRDGQGAGRDEGDAGRGEGGWEAEGTLLPFYLDPMTKLFLVALIWCRPWLLDPRATKPLPRTPEIARAALEVTGAFHELERFDGDQEYRDLCSARVAEHIKVLRRKIADRGLAAADVRLSDEVAVRILIDHGIITNSDLRRLQDPVWRSRQEDLWWTQG